MSSILKYHSRTYTYVARESGASVVSQKKYVFNLNEDNEQQNPRPLQTPSFTQALYSALLATQLPI
jgi:hypothetical protein